MSVFRKGRFRNAFIHDTSEKTSVLYTFGRYMLDKF